MSTFALIRSLLLVAIIVFACYNWWRIPEGQRSRFFALVGVLLLLALAVEIGGLVTSLFGVHNGLMYSCYAVLELAVVMALVTTVYQRLRIAAAIAAVLGCAAVTADVLSLKDPSWMAETGIVTTTSIEAVFVLVALWQLSETVDEGLSKDPRAWVLAGLFMSCATLAPVMGTFGYISHRFPVLEQNLYLFVQVMSMARYLLIGLACRRTSAQQHPNAIG